jgi:hypothetical protein
VRDQVPQTYIKHRPTRHGNKKAMPKFPLFCTNINYTALIILPSLNAKLKPGEKSTLAYQVVEKSLQSYCRPQNKTKKTDI